MPILYVIGFLVLAGSLLYLYQNPSMPAGVAQEAARVDTLQQQLDALTGRLAQLEQRPAPEPAAAPGVGPLEARIAVLEPQLSALEPRLSALEPQLSALEPRLSALEQRPAPAVPPPPLPPDFGPLTARVDAGLSKVDDSLSKQAADIQGLNDRLGAGLQGATERINAVEGRVAAVEKQGSAISGQLGGITERSQRVTRMQVATAALESGQKLGDIPGAPPALARFANEAPPTETGLRLSFNAAADAAQHVSQPAIMDDKPFAARLWTRAQQAVTVRQGDRVLLGDPVAGVLGHARQALDAGDLPGALLALNGLAGPAAAAMADWTGQARALLDARAALASMAARS